jgi:hypothetical protein
MHPQETGPVASLRCLPNSSVSSLVARNDEPIEPPNAAKAVTRRLALHALQLEEIYRSVIVHIVHYMGNSCLQPHRQHPPGIVS